MRILVTGASGFLGAWICKALIADSKHEVIAHSLWGRLPNTLNVSHLKVDLCEETAVSRLFECANPDAVIHTAALSDPNFCEENPGLSKRINIEASRFIANECQRRDIGLVFTSTDLVFDGHMGAYSEIDAANPVNIYGRHKVEAETAIHWIQPQATIVRLPWMFGIGLTKCSPFSSYLKRLKAKQVISGFIDEYRSPVSYPVAAAGIVKLLGQAPGRLLHLGGPERVSRYEFLRSLAALSGNDPDLVLAQKQNEAVFAAKRPADVSLESNAAYALGYQPPGLEAMIMALLNYDEDPKGSRKLRN